MDVQFSSGMHRPRIPAEKIFIGSTQKNFNEGLRFDAAHGCVLESFASKGMVCLGSQRIETEELTRREKTDDRLSMIAIDIRNPHDPRQNQIDELCVLVLLENDRVFIIRLHGQVSRQLFQLTRGK